MIRFTALVLSSLVLAACGPRGDTLATVDGAKVTQQQFDAYLKFKRLPVSEKEPERFRSVLDQYLERKALAAAVEDAMDDNKEIDGEVIEAELDEFRTEQMISRYFEHFLKDAASDEAVANYYNSHGDQYSERRVHVAHILLRTSRAMSENERKAALTKAQEAHSKVKAGMDFAKAAETYSEDSISAKKGGGLGWVKEGAIDPKFSQTAFELPAGEVSAPFETQFGFHVVKVLEAPQVQTQPLESVKGDIRYRLRSEAKEAELARLRETISIKKRDS